MSHPNQQSEAVDAFTERNREYFDKLVPNYTAEQWQRDLISKVTAFIRDNIEWMGCGSVDSDGKSFRVLDYACGPGTITYALNFQSAEYVGVDISQNMVDAYNHRFSDEGSSLNASAVIGNLLDGGQTALAGPEYHDFDMAVVGLGFHHFENVGLATRKLAERLRPGGVLLIIDFVSHGAEGLPGTHTVAHHGFSEDQVRKLFSESGLVDVGFVVMDSEVQIRNAARTPFLAKGRKLA